MKITGIKIYDIVYSRSGMPAPAPWAQKIAAKNAAQALKIYEKSHGIYGLPHGSGYKAVRVAG